MGAALAQEHAHSRPWPVDGEILVFRDDDGARAGRVLPDGIVGCGRKATVNHVLRPVAQRFDPTSQGLGRSWASTRNRN